MGDEPLPELMMALLIGFARARIFSSEFMQTSIVIKAREIIDIPDKQEEFVPHPCSKFKGEFARPPLKLKHGLVLTFHIKIRMHQLIYTLIVVNLC